MNHIDRRTLLGAAVGGVFASRAFAAAVPIGPMAKAAALVEGRSAPTEKVLFIFLRGGMDGVSAVVPVGDPSYLTHRTVGGTPLVDPNTTLPLIGAGGNGFARLHPRMQALVAANSPWAQRELAFIHQVGNSAGGRSHFSEMARLESGETASASVLDPEGWIPRLLSSAAVTSPLGGATVSPLVQRLFQSSANPMLHVRDVDRFQRNGFNPQLQLHLSQTPPATSPVEVRVDAIGDRMVAAQTALAAAPVQFAHDPTHFPWVPGDPWPLVTPPTGQLRGFLHDLEGALYLLRETDCCVAGVELGSFDTHNSEAAELTPLLEVLAFGMWSVWDVANGNISLTTLAMSEFGRTAAANGNAGTDHGLGGLMIASGPRVIGGVYNCDLTATLGAAWSPLSTQFGLPPANVDWNAIPVATHFLVIFREMIEKLFGITATGTLTQILPGLSTMAPAGNLGFLI